jgi:hypothetical protein
MVLWHGNAGRTKRLAHKGCEVVVLPSADLKRNLEGITFKTSAEITGTPTA